MLFNSFEFLIFLPVVFLLYWFVFKSLKWQNLFVVAASYLFYGWWDARFLILIAFTTFCSFGSGILLEKKEGDRNLQKWISVANILLNLLIGASSELYKKLYDMGNCYSVPSIEYEFDKNYAHILIIGQSNEPEKLYEMFKEEVKKFILNGVNEQDFERTKKMIYGEYVKEYDDVVNISRMFLSDYFKGINSFDYLEEINTINVEYLNQVLKDVFNEKNMILSVVKN